MLNARIHVVHYTTIVTHRRATPGVARYGVEPLTSSRTGHMERKEIRSLEDCDYRDAADLFFQLFTTLDRIRETTAWLQQIHMVDKWESLLKDDDDSHPENARSGLQYAALGGLVAAFDSIQFPILRLCEAHEPQLYSDYNNLLHTRNYVLHRGSQRQGYSPRNSHGVIEEGDKRIATLEFQGGLNWVRFDQEMYDCQCSVADRLMAFIESLARQVAVRHRNAVLEADADAQRRAAAAGHPHPESVRSALGLFDSDPVGINRCRKNEGCNLATTSNATSSFFEFCLSYWFGSEDPTRRSCS